MYHAIIYYFCTLVILYTLFKLPRIDFSFLQFQGFASLNLFGDPNRAYRILKQQEQILNTKPQKNELILLRELQEPHPNSGRTKIRVIEKPDPKYNKKYRKLPPKVQITLN